MYERAAETADALQPIWHLDRARGLFVGPLTYNAPHAHSVPVYLAGLYDSFQIRVGSGALHRCRTAVVPAGVPYELHVGGNPISVLYLEPSEAGVDALVPLVSDAVEQDGAVIARGGEIASIRALYEAAEGAGCVSDALDDLVGFAKKRARRALDPRIALAVERLAENNSEIEPVAATARKVGLSPSRFQHLFAEEIGVPYRRFRVWQKLRAAIAEVASGSSLTEAAHAAGFCDQAHFANAFRRSFGAPATPSLGNVRRVAGRRRTVA